MEISDFMPALGTKLMEYFKNHPDPKMAAQAKTISIIAAMQLGVAAIMYSILLKMQQMDEQNPNKEDLKRETQTACVFAVLSPGSLTLARQMKGLNTGYHSFKDGLQKRNTKKIGSGLILIVGTYFIMTNIFSRQKGIFESLLAKF